MVVTTVPWLALTCGVLPLAIGEALGTPVLLAATRRYSTTAQRSMSFSLIYMVMNIGYLAAGYIFDFVRRSDRALHHFWALSRPRTSSSSWSAWRSRSSSSRRFTSSGAETTDEGTSVGPAHDAASLLGSHRGDRAAECAGNGPLFRRLIGQPAFNRILCLLS